MLITHKLLSLNSTGLQLIEGIVKNQALVKQYSVPRGTTKHCDSVGNVLV